jgi:predicted nucleic acid-binding protein
MLLLMQRSIWVTEAVLLEIGDALAREQRAFAAAFIEQCYRTPNLRVVSVATPLLQRALAIFQARPDKTWGLTDCLSFVVMQDHELTDALTTDGHFTQVGFRALLRETFEPQP